MTSKILVFCLSLLCFFSTSAQKDFTQFVNPLIGSAPSTTVSAMKHSEAGNESKGQIAPAIGMPQGMTTWTPQTRATEKKCIPPFYYQDNEIQGFRGTHWMNGSCVQDYGSFTVMPLAGKLITGTEERGSTFNRQYETVQAHNYEVVLERYGIKVQMTGTTRAGFMQFTYQNEEDNYLLIEPNSDEGEGYVKVDVEKKEIVGYNPVHRIYQGNGQSAGFSGYFVAQIEGEIESGGVWRGDDIMSNSYETTGTGNREMVGGFVKVKGKTLKVRIGTSFTSLEQARKNLDAEIAHWSFEKTKNEAKEAWNKVLGKIEVKGSEEDKTLFYSALYHAKLTPRIFSDADGTYPGFAENDKTEKAEGFVYYEDYNLWDTFRAVHPLHNILEPKTSSDMMQSLVVKAEQGDWLPIFPCWNEYTSAMIGDHAISAISDAYVKGIKGFDIEKAYKYMRKNAFEVNTDKVSYEQGKGRRALKSYLEYNYIPMEDPVLEAFHKREQVSRTLEYAYDDYALAQVAKALGHDDDYNALIKRSKNYKNVIDPSIGWARGRHEDGSWSKNFDQYASRASFITEGSPAQYTFYVPHDVPGLINHVGGEERFLQQLDSLFDYDYYWHGNEPNNQIAYLYAYTSQPQKAAERLQKIIREEYDTSPGGLSGNEDGGQMSAWLVFSMMGFYPVSPGSTEYALAKPIFKQVKIHLDNGKTVKISADKKNTTKHFLEHDELMRGGKIRF
ncbi:alpha-1,2-mannosidase, putative [Spirosomataceae bacterium TFI 002]|nr:alpha-1,2-mannosidase, putative [Spirosomataceae bacterium TFI 002]